MFPQVCCFNCLFNSWGWPNIYRRIPWVQPPSYPSHHFKFRFSISVSCFSIFEDVRNTCIDKLFWRYYTKIDFDSISRMDLRPSVELVRSWTTKLHCGRKGAYLTTKEKGISFVRGAMDKKGKKETDLEIDYESLPSANLPSAWSCAFIFLNITMHILFHLCCHWMIGSYGMISRMKYMQFSEN